MLTCAAGNSTTVIIALYQFKRGSERPLAEIRDHFPVIYRMLEDVHITRLTTSYDVLKPCLSKHLGPRIGRDLVDVLHMASVNRPRDFAAMEGIRRPTENLAAQTLVWSYIGLQKGPMPAEAQWHKFQELPWDEARHAMYHFSRGNPLTPQQLLWQYQLVRAGVVATAQTVRQHAREPEKEWGEEQMSAVYSAGLHRFQSQHDIPQESYFSGLHKDRHYKEPELPQPMLGHVPTRVSMITPPSSAPLPSYRRSGHPPPSPRNGNGTSGRRDAHAGNVHPGGWEHSRQPSGSRPSAGLRHEPEHGLRKPKRRSSSPASGHGPPKKTAYQLDLDRDIKKRRGEFRAQAPSNDPHPLEPGSCKDCGQSPPHEDPKDCIVHQLKEGLVDPPVEGWPCQYCGFEDHMTFACLFGHATCTKCGHNGHMDFECHRRTTEEWLVLFLLFVLCFKGPRICPGGPLGGRYGFGKVNPDELLGATRTLLQEKEEALKRLRAEGKCPTESQALQAAWMALIQERKTQGPQWNTQLVARLEQALARCRAPPPPPPPPTKNTPKEKRRGNSGRSAAASTISKKETSKPEASSSDQATEQDELSQEIAAAERFFASDTEPMDVGSNVSIRDE